MIPVLKPYYNKEKILSELGKVLDSGWTGLGPKTEEFENELCKFTGAKYCLFLNSCTSALHLALQCLGIEKGKVLVPDITFASTASIVLHSGLELVLMPVYKKDVCLNLEYLEQYIVRNSDVKAIIPVHYSGNCVHMENLKVLCDALNIKIIEDCAHALGSKFYRQHVGTIGDIGCFSFHSVKNLPISDGGALVTNNEEIYQKAKKLRWLGIDKSTYDRSEKNYSYSYDIEENGYKYHGNDMLAVVGLANLELLESMNSRRKALYYAYMSSFKNITDFEIRQENFHTNSSHAMITATIDKSIRDEYIDFMGRHGISIGVHYKPLSSFKAFQSYASDVVKEHSWEVFQELVTLPSYPTMTSQEQMFVANKTMEFIR